MDLETAIKTSEWWRQAREMPDRHFDPSAGVALADHLEVVHGNLRLLDRSDETHEYFSQLRRTLVAAGLDPADVAGLLAPVALLHDIGKSREEKGARWEDPLTGKVVELRHPVLGVMAARELLPGDLPGRETILALIQEHDTPYSWYMQFVKTAQVPKQKAWARLDRKIDPREDGTGLVLLSIFKLADVHGHDSAEDVPWFIEQANDHYLRQKDRCLPVPDLEAIGSLENMVG